MSCQIVIISFLLSTIYGSSSVTTDIEIPIVRDSRGRAIPSVDISIDDVSPPVIRLAVHLGPNSRSLGGVCDEAYSGLLSSRYVRMVEYPTEIFEYGWEGQNSMTEGRVSMAQFAIGSGSVFLSHFQSLSILQNATYPVSLLLRSSREHFERRCEPGSVISTFYNGREIGGIITFTHEIAPSEISRNNRVKLSDDAIAYDGSIWLSHERFLELESRMRTHHGIVSSYLLTWGLVSYGILDNCTYVPNDVNITLTTFEHEDGSGTRGQVFISADEFMILDRATNRCAVKMSRDRDFSVLNPLKVPGMNMRITAQPTDNIPGTLQFCDSSF